MNVRILSAVALAALLAGLTSCQSEPVKPADTGKTDAQTSAAVETDIYSGLPEKDLGGAGITFISYSPSYGDKEYTFAEQTGEIIDDAIYQRNLLTEQRLGVSLKFSEDKKETDAQNALIASVLAGDGEYDMALLKNGNMGNLLTNEVLAGWNGVEGYDLGKPWYVKDANETYTFGGELYGIYSDALATNITCAWSFIYNKRIAREYQLPELNKTVREGGWTMERLTGLTKNVWKDLNGNNERDADDMYGFYADKWGPLDPFMQSHGITSISKDSGDYPVVDFYSERLVSSFEKVYSLFWENPGAYIISTGNDYYGYVRDFASGQALFSPMFVDYLIKTDMRAMEDDYGVLPFPKLDEAQEEYYTYVLPRFGAFYLPASLSEKKLGMAGYVVECMSAYSYQYLRPAIFDVSLTEKGMRDEDSTEMLDLIIDSRVYDFSSCLQTAGSFPFTQDKTYRNLIGGQKNVNIASYYDSNAAAAGKFLSELTAKLK